MLKGKTIKLSNNILLKNIFKKNYSIKTNNNENIFTYLNERNLVNNISHNELLNENTNINSFLKDNPKVYIGFDPTAESLHLGNLIGILTALRFGAFGIEPIFLVGGATGQIGDPSGKNKERPLLNKDKIENNLNMIEDNIKSFMNEIKNFSDFKNFCNSKSILRNSSEILKNNKLNISSSSSGSDDEERSQLIEYKLKKISDKSIFKNDYESLNLSDSININNKYDNFLKSLEYANKDKLKNKKSNFTAETEFFNYKIINNMEFYKDLNIIDFLREAGTNLRMGPLLSREMVKNRLNTKEGISLTEFMYQAFQGYDFLKLFEKHNVKIQIGGSDQWGNMLAGYELVKKMKNFEVLTMTFPLMTTSNGQKFGKSEGNALFINPKLTPINSIFQYFFNSADSDLLKLFNTFTFIEKEEIREILDFHNKKPELRNAQKILAEKITNMLFSEEEAKKCFKNCQAHYLNLSNNCEEELDQILKDCHLNEISEDCLDKMSISALCVREKILTTKAQCKRLIQSGSLFINNNKITEDVVINKNLFLNGRYLVLKTGKKNTHIFQIVKQEKLESLITQEKLEILT